MVKAKRKPNRKSKKTTATIAYSSIPQSSHMHVVVSTVEF